MKHKTKNKSKNNNRIKKRGWHMFKEAKFYIAFFLGINFSELIVRFIQSVSGFYNVWVNFVYAWIFTIIMTYKIYDVLNVMNKQKVNDKSFDRF